MDHKGLASKFSSLLQNAVDSLGDSVDTSRLVQNPDNGDCVNIKKDLDTVLGLKSWAPLKGVVASVASKIIIPQWDTRNHQVQIGGLCSLRSIDHNHVAPFLYKHGLYNNTTAFALTRTFEKSEPYTQTYSGQISPVEYKHSFLNLVEIINTVATPELLNDILIYLLFSLNEQKKRVTSMKAQVVISCSDLNINDVSNVLDQMNEISSGASVLPVITAHTLLTLIQPYLWPGVSIKPLKEHTAADNHSKSYGDIEGVDSTSKPIIAIEVKHKIAIDASIEAIFDEKTRNADIHLKYILTTKTKTEKRFTQTNICIDTINGFVTSHLQTALFHERAICLKFVIQLRQQIVTHPNLGESVKETINEIITSLLASPSP